MMRASRGLQSALVLGRDICRDCSRSTLLPRFSQAGPDIALRLIGRNDAPTFAGFCNQHDTERFRPLDTRPFDGADRKQLLLLA